MAIKLRGEKNHKCCQEGKNNFRKGSGEGKQEKIGITYLSTVFHSVSLRSHL